VVKPEEIAKALGALGLEPKVNHPMKRVGFWRLGGTADVFVKVPDLSSLQTIIELDQPITLVGNGSNMLIADQGIRGITIRLVGDFLESRISQEGSVARVMAGAGLLNTVLLRRMNKDGVVGLACLAGVPGTVGGAIRMNAGTSLGQLADKELHAVEVCTADGVVHTRMRESIEFSYRWASLPSGAIITRAWFRLDQSHAEEIQKAIALHLTRRMATQPLDQPSCGSVFKNPEGDFAGRLIEAAGLKGVGQGGAQISTRHANFIVNTGGASAEDVYTLITRARTEVWRQFGVLLEPEVHAVGDWPEGAWPLPHPEAQVQVR
jgi:UDP-N-acetylmuramate dehydrogenase